MCEMTVGEEQAAKEYLLTRVIDIFEEVTRSGPYSVSREWFTMDLTMPQVRVLFLLLQEGALRMSGLASTLDVSMSSATGLVDRLVDKETGQPMARPGGPPLRALRAHRRRPRTGAATAGGEAPPVGGAADAHV